MQPNGAVRSSPSRVSLTLTISLVLIACCNASGPVRVYQDDDSNLRLEAVDGAVHVNANSLYLNGDDIALSSSLSSLRAGLQASMDTQLSTMQATLDAKLSTAIAAVAQVPPGTIMAFAGLSPPPGYHLCDGTALNRTQYSQLFAVIGDVYGAGDGSTTFNIPNTRGMFLRGTGQQTVNAGAGGSFYVGPSLGGYQQDTVLNHHHSAGTLHTGLLPPNPTVDILNNINMYSPELGSSHAYIWNASPSEQTLTGGESGDISTAGAIGVENRPVNLGVNYIIKL